MNLTKLIILGGALALGLARGWGATNVYLTGVPDYGWWAGCFGTASGNLMGFWDRHGFPDFYTGPTSGGVAPLDNNGSHFGIVSMWASQAGLDGRPADQYGHYDDYYAEYESTDPDPFVSAGRPEHTADCLGDFIGLSQWKWRNMGGECDGNIDAYCFNYWDASGDKRVNFTPGPEAGVPARDLQSGLRAWTRYRGYDCVAFSQLTDFNPNLSGDKGFSFNDLMAEIDAGYPVLIWLQNDGEFTRPMNSQPVVNPNLHGMLAYGYYVNDDGSPYVRYRTSWASGDNRLQPWGAQPWEAGLAVRGVIGYRPLPIVRQYRLSDGNLSLQWDGPAAEIYIATLGVKYAAQGYVVEMATSLATQDFKPVSPVILENSYTITNCPSPAFVRLKLVKP